MTAQAKGSRRQFNLNNHEALRGINSIGSCLASTVTVYIPYNILEYMVLCLCQVQNPIQYRYYRKQVAPPDGKICNRWRSHDDL